MDKVKLKDVLTDKIGYFCKLHTGNFNICDCTDKECFKTLISEIISQVKKEIKSYVPEKESYKFGRNEVITEILGKIDKL